MSAPFPLLLIAAACADWFISLRPLNLVTKLFADKASNAKGGGHNGESIAPEQLFEAVSGLAGRFLFRGALQEALENPHERPDLIPHFTHLARLEHQLELLSLQSERAEHRVEFLTHKEGGCGYQEMFEAEKYSNKVQQQIVRLLKDIQKARKDLEKAVAQPQGDANHSLMPKQPAATPAQTVSVQAVIETKQLEPSAQNIPISPPPTEEEFLQCIVRNRDRIRNAPAKDREKLMIRLIEEHRSKSKQRAA